MQVDVEEFCKGIVKWYNTENREFVKLGIKEKVKELYMEIENAR